MSFGIAIPTYSKHLKYLDELLSSIEKNTILPNAVSISCSNVDNFFSIKDYKFKVILTTTNDYKNPSQNRNIAASKLDTDIISFIDGDDISTHFRNEYLISAIRNESNRVVCHNYAIIDEKIEVTPLNVRFRHINTCGDISLYPVNNEKIERYHCAHITVTNDVFCKFKYNEGEHLKYKEDSEYLQRIVSSGIYIDYIANKLSHYRV